MSNNAAVTEIEKEIIHCLSYGGFEKIHSIPLLNYKEFYLEILEGKYPSILLMYEDLAIRRWDDANPFIVTAFFENDEHITLPPSKREILSYYIRNPHTMTKKDLNFLLLKNKI